MRPLFTAAFTFTLLSACGDKEPAEEIQDADGDGILSSEDCDDDDPAVGGDEVAYDGVDNDCDPSTHEDDLDGDGFVRAEDCDDTNPSGWLPPSKLRATLFSASGFQESCEGYCERTLEGSIGFPSGITGE